jgi:hypothetical protein
MAGVKGRSGGARPGAGRKRKETVEMQGNRRDALLDVVTERLWRETVKGWFETARETKNYALLFPLLPYIMGAAKQEINVSGQVEHADQRRSRRSASRVGKELLRVMLGGTPSTAVARRGGTLLLERDAAGRRGRAPVRRRRLGDAAGDPRRRLQPAFAGRRQGVPRLLEDAHGRHLRGPDALRGRRRADDRPDLGTGQERALGRGPSACSPAR